MIQSKPKRSTLISISIFLLIDVALIAATLNSINNSKVIYWYHYLFLAVLISIGLIVLLKVLWGYRITTIGKGRIEVRYPVKFSRLIYPIKDIREWKEETIKTPSGKYQQVEIYFLDKKKITLGRQEHTEYDSVLKYLIKKVGKKKVK